MEFAQILTSIFVLLIFSFAAKYWIHKTDKRTSSQLGKAAVTSVENMGKTKNKNKSKKNAKTSQEMRQSKTSSSLEKAENPSTTKSVSQDIPDYYCDDDSSGDSDEGLTAAQVLEKTTFKPVTVGGKLAFHFRPKYSEGQTILARFNGGSEWFPGKIAKIQNSNRYIVHYDDGESESQVPEELLRPRGAVLHLDDLDSKDTTKDVGRKEIADVVEHSTEDEWEIISALKKVKDPNAPRYNADTGEEILTKKQRESRRKKEKQREQKEIMRASAQERGLHGRWQQRA